MSVKLERGERAMPDVERPGCQLAYELLDVTPPWVEHPETIVFYHGVSVTAALWSDWIPVLCNDYRILTFDTRGFGRSAPHDPEIPWSMELMVGDLLAVADAAALTRFHLVGESAGGTAALATAMSHPARIASLTVSNGAANGTAIQNVRGVWTEQLGQAGRDA
jgi:pimeloyl-ACP methyl ester carboxylesterase